MDGCTVWVAWTVIWPAFVAVLGHRTCAELLGTPGGGTPGCHRALKGISVILCGCTQMQYQLGYTGRHFGDCSICDFGLCVMSQTNLQCPSAHGLGSCVLHISSQENIGL